MKTTKKILPIVLIIVLAAGCNKGLKKEVEHLRQDKQQMESTIEEQNQTISENRDLLSEIDQKLKSAIEEEVILQNLDKEDIRSRINFLTEEIDKQMQQYRMELESEETDLRNSRYRVTQLKKEVASLENLIASKNDSVMMLQSQVNKLNVRIKDLDEKVSELQMKNNVQSEKIDQLDNELNAAYFVVESTNELVNKGIIEKVGGFLGLFGRTEKLSSDFSLDPFTKVNRQDMAIIEINAKNLELITAHPSRSYKIHEENNLITKLAITDPQEFWQASKYLVISVR